MKIYVFCRKCKTYIHAEIWEHGTFCTCGNQIENEFVIYALVQQLLEVKKCLS